MWSPWCGSGVGLQLNRGSTRAAGRGAAYMQASSLGWWLPLAASGLMRQVYFEALQPTQLFDVGCSSVSSDRHGDGPCLLVGMSLGPCAQAAWHWPDACRSRLGEAAELAGCRRTGTTGRDNRSGLGRSRQSCSGCGARARGCWVGLRLAGGALG